MYFFGIHLKAIQIAVRHFLYQELEGIHLTHIFLYLVLSLLRLITIFIATIGLVAHMRIIHTCNNARIRGYMHLIKHEYLA